MSFYPERKKELLKQAGYARFIGDSSNYAFINRGGVYKIIDVLGSSDYAYRLEIEGVDDYTYHHNGFEPATRQDYEKYQLMTALQ